MFCMCICCKFINTKTVQLHIYYLITCFIWYLCYTGNSRNASDADIYRKERFFVWFMNGYCCRAIAKLNDWPPWQFAWYENHQERICGVRWRGQGRKSGPPASQKQRCPWILVRKASDEVASSHQYIWSLVESMLRQMQSVAEGEKFLTSYQRDQFLKTALLRTNISINISYTQAIYFKKQNAYNSCMFYK